MDVVLDQIEEFLDCDQVPRNITGKPGEEGLEGYSTETQCTYCI